jgi:polyprenyl P-hydroxybenzoate/phenylacrylic acid decarboxylase-like protein
VKRRAAGSPGRASSRPLARSRRGSAGSRPSSRRGRRAKAPAGGEKRRLIVAITGATGAIYGIRLLEALRGSDVETHLVISRWGARTLLHETSYTLERVRGLATHSYASEDQGALISSGSFQTLGMVVVPCSVRTLSAIACARSENLIQRAADVVLKERRRLVLCVRETPFNDIHLEHMLTLSRMGAVIAPPLPAFYTLPRTLEDTVDHSVGRILDLFGLPFEGGRRWSGFATTSARRI